MLFFAPIHDLKTLTLASGASLSDSAILGAMRPVGIVMPATWTAASLTFQASVDGGVTWHDLYDDSTEATVSSASANRYIALDPALFAGVFALRVRSGTSAAPVNQGAARTLTLVARPL